MKNKWIFAVLITFASMGLAGAGGVGMSEARADLVVNGGFENASAFNGTYKNFADSDVEGWTLATSSLLLAPGYAETNSIYPVYGPFPNASPDGGNFFETRASPAAADTLTQTISGLTVGQGYAVSFYEAGGQLQDATGSTSELWAVTFGTDQQYSDGFSLAQGGVGDWHKQTLKFTAGSTVQDLTFRSLGVSDFTDPVIFLDGVSVTATPLPAAFFPSILVIASLAGWKWINKRKSLRLKPVTA